MPLSYSVRAKNASNPVATRLLQLMDAKKTNLCVSADLTSAAEILQLAEAVGDEICVLKTHIDVISDFTLDGVPPSGDPAAVIQNFTDRLRALAEAKNFLIFEDRKFADIGNTVAMQFEKGIYRIADWADIVNVHGVTSYVDLEILQQIARQKGREIGLLVLAQMTPEQLPGAVFFDAEYARKAFAVASAAHSHYQKIDGQSPVLGFIGSAEQPEILRGLSMRRYEHAPEMLILTPGIQLAGSGDGTGQTYNTPEKALLNGSDIIIVGRGVYKAADQRAAAQQYRAVGWAAHEKSLAESV